MTPEEAQHILGLAQAGSLLRIEILGAITAVFSGIVAGAAVTLLWRRW
jgi:hypothetical protein